MSTHAKAASAGSTERSNGKRRLGGLLATLALALCVIGSGASAASAASPTVTINPASELGFTTAKATGEVAAEGKEASYHFEYLTDAQFDENEANTLPPFEGAAQVGFGSVEAAGTANPEVHLEGLISGTEYHLRLVAENEDGQDIDIAPNFTTQTATAPVLSVDPATGVSFTKAHVTASIDPEGGNKNPGATDPLSIGWELQLSTTPGENFGAWTGGGIEGAQAGSSTAIETPSGGFTFEGLANNTTYYYRLVGYYAGKQVTSSEESFTTDLVTKPVVEIDPASSVTGQTVHFSGEVTVANEDAAFNANCNFDYVTDAQFQIDGYASAQTVGCTPNPVQGTIGVEVEADPTGLIPHTVYHLRLRAENQGGQETDDAPTFETETIGPQIQGTSVSGVTTTEAVLHAEVNPGGADTTYHFEYLTLDEYEEAGETFAGAAQTPESASIGSDFTYHQAEAPIEGLAEDTPYRFRVVATNEKSPVGGTVGPVRALHTSATPVSEADTCPNVAVRAQQGSQYLPECRAYEIVNKPTLDIGDVNRSPVISDDGEFASYLTLIAPDNAVGAALGSAFVAHRSSTGWHSTDANAQSPRAISNTMQYNPLAFSPDFSEELNFANVQINPEDIDQTTDLYRVHVGLGEADWLTPGLTLPDAAGGVPIAMGASTDLGRVVFLMQGQSLLPGAPNQGIYISEGNSLELISINPDGTAMDIPYPAGFGFKFGLGDLRPDGSFVAYRGQHAVSDDASRIFLYRETGPGTNVTYLYLRDHGTTIPISASQRAADLGQLSFGQFISAPHDGSAAYFVSPAQLTEDAPPGGGIYRFDVATKSLTLLTPDAGDPAGLQLKTAYASDDQSHIYFTSTSVLDSGAVAGENNAYVWTQAGGTRFIARTPQVPYPGTPDRFYRVSRDGRYALLFGADPIDGAPSNGHDALYEYDYNTDRLTCVSCRPDGSLSEGDANLEEQSAGFPAPPYTAARGLTDDGKVFFATSDRLVARDQTSAADVYLYDKGKLSLISSGRGKYDTYLGDNSADGHDVFLMTRSPLVGADLDAQELDLYDVRIDGGFLEPPAPAAPCEGEACRGAGSKAPAAPGAATTGFVGPGNPKPCAKGKVRRNGRCVKKHHRKKHARSTKKHTRDANANGRTGR